jgi:hypothetical protein
MGEIKMIERSMFPKAEGMSIILYVKESNAKHAALRIVVLELNEKKDTDNEKGKVRLS